jgi:hypothetical protein
LLLDPLEVRAERGELPVSGRLGKIDGRLVTRPRSSSRPAAL